MGDGQCPFCHAPIRPTAEEAQAAEWAFGLVDSTTPGSSRGGVLYRLKCPSCAVPLIAAPGRQWAEVEAAQAQWSHDPNAHLIFGGQQSG